MMSLFHLCTALMVQSGGIYSEQEKVHALTLLGAATWSGQLAPGEITAVQCGATQVHLVNPQHQLAGLGRPARARFMELLAELARRSVTFGTFNQWPSGSHQATPPPPAKPTAATAPTPQRGPTPPTPASASGAVPGRAPTASAPAPKAANVVLPPQEELLKLTAKQLKLIIKKGGLSDVGCFEKRDLVERMYSAANEALAKAAEEICECSSKPTSTPSEPPQSAPPAGGRSDAPRAPTDPPAAAGSEASRTPTDPAVERSKASSATPEAVAGSSTEVPTTPSEALGQASSEAPRIPVDSTTDHGAEAPAEPSESLAQGSSNVPSTPLGSTEVANDDPGKDLDTQMATVDNAGSDSQRLERCAEPSGDDEAAASKKARLGEVKDTNDFEKGDTVAVDGREGVVIMDLRPDGHKYCKLQWLDTGEESECIEVSTVKPVLKGGDI